MGCKIWKERPDPKGTALHQRWKTWRILHGEMPSSKCPECQRRVGHHRPGCSFSREELDRKLLLIKHEIDPAQFEVFLRALAQRYEQKSVHSQEDGGRSSQSPGEGISQPFEPLHEVRIAESHEVEVCDAAETVDTDEKEPSSGYRKVWRPTVRFADKAEGIKTSLSQSVDGHLQDDRDVPV